MSFSRRLTLTAFDLMASPTNSGSRWLRWEPHIHAPGTVLNDQFGGGDHWPSYLNALEASSPPIRALGITDYYSTETYERVCQSKAEGRLQSCDLVFPNVEMRLALGMVKGRWVNVHLLVDPTGVDHLGELKRFLGPLSFDAHGASYNCSREDLIRLGRKVEPKATEDRDAFSREAEQFKVSFDQLRKVYGKSDRAQQNMLIGVAGNEGSGISGVRDAADQVLRTEVEKFSHFISASGPTQRDFWLGRGKTLSEDDMRARYGGLKPCLHGSDAHSHERVGALDGDRFCWLKGAPEFDALQQACRDPAGRAYVGTESPIQAIETQIIKTIDIDGAAWAQTPSIALNPGLVAIIGARGSGKTALADMIALGCDSTSQRLSQASFLERAGADGLLAGAVVRLDMGYRRGDQAAA